MSGDFMLAGDQSPRAADLQEAEQLDRDKAIRDIALLALRFDISISEIASVLSTRLEGANSQGVFKPYDPIFND